MADTEALPPLPDPLVLVRDTDDMPENGGWIVDCDCEGPNSYSLEANQTLYTAEQMRDYAHAALRAQTAQQEAPAGMLVKRDEWEDLSPEAQDHLTGIAAQARAKATSDAAAASYWEGRARLSGVGLTSATPTAQPREHPKYLNDLVDRLLMPPQSMTERQLRQLHEDAAEMLRLLSRPTTLKETLK